jgi:hypothetical protein
VTDHPDGQVWLPLTDAADHLGMSRHQLRRRVRAGTIASRQVQGQHGPAYEVLIDADATVASSSRHADGRNGDATVTLTPPLTELVNLLRDTQRQNVELAGMVGSLQQRLLYAEDRIRALEAPAPESTQDAFSDAPAHVVSSTTSGTSDARGTRQARRWWRFW